MLGERTRYKDKNGRTIWVGDWVHVEEDPVKHRGGTLDYEGIVEVLADGTPIVTYYDFGMSEYTPLGYFPKTGREVITRYEKESKDADL